MKEKGKRPQAAEIAARLGRATCARGTRAARRGRGGDGCIEKGRWSRGWLFHDKFELNFFNNVLSLCVLARNVFSLRPRKVLMQIMVN